MKKAIDGFLMSDRVLYSMPWIFSLTAVSFDIFSLIFNQKLFSVSNFGYDFMYIFLAFGIAISYKIHEKNIMKTLFGAIMAERIIYSLSWCISSFENSGLLSDKVFMTVRLILYIIMFINHIALGYGHKSNHFVINFNRIISCLIIVNQIAANLGLMPYIPFVLDVVAELSILLEILCVETKVDAYKAIRESKAE